MKKFNPTKEEWVLIRESIMLRYLLSFCETQISKIKQSDNTLKSLYTSATTSMMAAINKDLDQIKKNLGPQIGVKADGQSGSMLKFRCFFRGMEDLFSIEREVMRVEMGVRLNQYIKKLGNSLSEVK